MNTQIKIGAIALMVLMLSGLPGSATANNNEAASAPPTSHADSASAGAVAPAAARITTAPVVSCDLTVSQTCTGLGIIKGNKKWPEMPWQYDEPALKQAFRPGDKWTPWIKDIPADVSADWYVYTAGRGFTLCSQNIYEQAYPTVGTSCTRYEFRSNDQSTWWVSAPSVGTCSDSGCTYLDFQLRLDPPGKGPAAGNIVYLYAVPYQYG